jgi:multicomponent Na+:H+ antiporter subunit B
MVLKMKPLTFYGLITCIIVVGVSIYAIEDLPAFGDENAAVNKYMELFRIPATPSLVDSLNAGVLPEEIIHKIYGLGFVPGPIFPGAQDERYPVIEGNYTIKRTEAGSLEEPKPTGRMAEAGWDVYLKEGEIYYDEPLVWFFIKEIDGNLSVLRYQWPARVMQQTVVETAMINAVTSGLADYRGYDTMGEETVILTGAIGVILLVRRRGRL